MMREKTYMISLPIILSLLAFGGFYSFSVYLTGAVVLLLLFLQLGKRKKSRTAKNEIYYGSLLLCVSALISVLAGVNKGMAWLGFLRVLVLAIWIFFLMQFSKEERDGALSILPYAGAIMVIVGMIAFAIPGMKAFFWQADRLGGIFQYSNTCALFLLIGLLVLTRNPKPQAREFLLFDILLLGIFLTGSKGAILLLIPVFIWVMIKKKEFRKNGIFVVGFLIVAGALYGVLSGDFQNIARIYTIFQYPSTLLGRLLYMKDALPVLLSHPLGIGYMGYAGMQSEIQTGVYTSLFVHNDWMQMALDFGWIFLLVSVGVIVWQLKTGRQESYKKLILLVICIYTLGEFHFQYLSIAMIIPLLFDFKEDTFVEKKSIVAKENQIFALLGMVLMCYFGIANLFTYLGKGEVALSLYPYDTQAMEAELSKETDKEKAVDLAKDIIKIHPYSSQSYNVLAYGELMDGNYEKALDYKLKVLELKKYNMMEYADLEEMTEVIQAGSDDTLTEAICEEALQEMQKLLSQTEKETSDLAYKLRDKPEFTWKDTSGEMQ